MAPPPPPPPALCMPFGSKSKSKKERRLSPSRTFSEKGSYLQSRDDLPVMSRRESYDSQGSHRSYESPTRHSRSRSMQMQRSHSDGSNGSHGSNGSKGSKGSRSGVYPQYPDYPRSQRNDSFSSSETVTTITKDGTSLAFKTDTESYNVRSRSSTPPPPQPKKLGWGFGWGLGRQRQKEKGINVDKGLVERKKSLLKRNNSVSSQATVTNETPYTTRSINTSQFSIVSPGPGPVLPVRPPLSTIVDESPRSGVTSPRRTDLSRSNTQNSKNSGRSGGSGRSAGVGGLVSRLSPKRPSFSPADSQDTLVGSALERKLSDSEVPRERADTTARLQDLRVLMVKDNLDYYVVPSEDAHGSEYVADSDKRREFISGFTGSAGQAIISKTSAYLVTDSRYWLQAEDELDDNWNLVRAPIMDGPRDWQAFVLSRVQEGSRIGLDARMISWAKASALNVAINKIGAKLVFPAQNLVDLVWKARPQRSKELISRQLKRFAGEDATSKLSAIRAWITEQPPAKPAYAKPGPPTEAQKHVATLVSGLSNIAWTLNLRGRDIPFNPVFQSYLFISLSGAVLFVDNSKVTDDVKNYLSTLKVDLREYNDLWSFLRRPTWGAGRVLISDDTSYAISLLLTHFRYTITPSPSHIDALKAVKNSTEIEGIKAAHLRDGACYVRWLAWLEDKLATGYEITEYEAAARLTEYRRKTELFEGLAYEPTSASGANAALPHYVPRKNTAKFIDRMTPYLNDSGAQYRDGTIDCTRTVHFGLPSVEQCEAYTRVLQGHIAIDAAIFPESTSGRALDVLARSALWKDGLNYLHGTGHGFGSYLNVHEGPHSFSSDVPLTPGHVITNEPGFYADGKFGVRIESALLVKRVSTKHEFNANQQPWLGFERLTCVPIQTKMVREAMLSKDEITWLKEHNKRCLATLEPILAGVDDKRALRWLKRVAGRGVGTASPVPGGIHINWD